MNTSNFLKLLQDRITVLQELNKNLNKASNAVTIYQNSIRIRECREIVTLINKKHVELN